MHGTGEDGRRGAYPNGGSDEALFWTARDPLCAVVVEESVKAILCGATR
jgi:hypothetical protein